VQVASPIAGRHGGQNRRAGLRGFRAAMDAAHQAHFVEARQVAAQRRRRGPGQGREIPGLDHALRSDEIDDRAPAFAFVHGASNTLRLVANSLTIVKYMSEF